MNAASLALAYSAGLLASVNPCGFAMLPAFVGTYIGVEDEAFARRSIARRAGDGAIVGVAVTAGFVVVFAAIGILIALAGNLFYRQFPGIVLVLGAALVGLGAWLASGRPIKLPMLAPDRAPTARGLAPAASYGAAYGLASLGCTLPVFLVVVGQAFSSSGITSGFVLFLSYAAGMGTVVVGVALGAALFKGALAGWLRLALPYVQQISGGLLVAAGSYLVVRELHVGIVGAPEWIRTLEAHAAIVTAVLIVSADVAAALLWWFAPRRAATDLASTTMTERAR